MAPRVRAFSWLLAALAAGVLACSSDATELPPPSGGGAGGSGGGGAGGSGGVAVGGSGGSGGVVAASCWGGDVLDWSLSVPDLTGLAGHNPADFMLADDGLSLFYAASSTGGGGGPAAPTRIHHATRASRDVPFTGGDELAPWVGIDATTHPWRHGDEIFLTMDHGGGVMDIAMTVLQSGSWSTPVALGGLVNYGWSNTDPTVGAHGTRLIYRHQDTTDLTDLDLRELARSDASAGTPFSTAAPVVFPGLGEDDFLMCPMLSPDGTELFFSTTYPNDVSQQIGPNVLTIWHSKRTSLDKQWQAPTHIEVFDATDQQACGYAIAADGCELWLQHFTLGEPSLNNYTVAKRTAD